MAIVNQRLAGVATVAPPQTTQANTTRVTVRSGDTMSGIATRTGLWPLSKWSVPSGNLNLIYPGQVVTSTAAGSVATGQQRAPATPYRDRPARATRSATSRHDSASATRSSPGIAAATPT